MSKLLNKPKFFVYVTSMLGVCVTCFLNIIVKGMIVPSFILLATIALQVSVLFSKIKEEVFWRRISSSTEKLCGRSQLADVWSQCLLSTKSILIMYSKSLSSRMPYYEEIPVNSVKHSASI